MNQPAPRPHDELDLEIHRTLTALGQVDPSPHLHDRVLGALAAASQAQDRHRIPTGPQARRSWNADIRSLGWRRPGSSIFGMPAALATVIMILLLIPFTPIVQRSRPGRQARLAAAPSRPAAPRADPPAAPSSPAADRAAQAEGSAAWTNLPPVRVSSLRPGSVSPEAGSIHLELSALPPIHPPTRADPDGQALADLHTPSFPAPPLPPTDQERLVRLMLRRGEKHDLAQLDPAATAAFAAQEERDFKAFFAPRPGPSPEAPTVTQDGPPASVQPPPLPDLFPPFQGDPK